jgi:hypothetical protein
MHDPIFQQLNIDEHGANEVCDLPAGAAA